MVPREPDITVDDIRRASDPSCPFCSFLRQVVDRFMADSMTPILVFREGAGMLLHIWGELTGFRIYASGGKSVGN